MFQTKVVWFRGGHKMVPLDKTRILVTHQLQYLQFADQIIVMNNGSIEQKGTFNQLQALNLDFMKLLKMTDAECKEDETKQFDKQCQNLTKSKKGANKASNIETHEITMKGHMSRKVFFAYFKASKKPFIIALMMVIFIVNQIVASGSDYFVAFWVNIESSSWHETSNSTTEFLWNGPLTRDYMSYIYSTMIAIIILLWQFQTIIYFSVCMWSSINLHSAMFRSILRTTTYFYNTNPAGRILNRVMAYQSYPYFFNYT
ncbi:Multidrug resistance-associated protein 5 [Camponotus floridanus]|uniref:Multidrug resistance-associated protein 5 n=1 Tax=Camponotus floridanus TaxID=104421 RepID=E2AF71_CAMFO|nr:Multidrug resistance-associated protein 5 [Camponotus floridanus]